MIRTKSKQHIFYRNGNQKTMVATISLQEFPKDPVDIFKEIKAIIHDGLSKNSKFFDICVQKCNDTFPITILNRKK